MILFKQVLRHPEMILRGQKTQTRRIGTKRWNVGAVHLAKTQMLSKQYFSKIRITNIREERLGYITLEDAQKEGCKSVEEYIDIWKWINKGVWDPELIVWVIDFELVYSDLKPGDIVTLSPECDEQRIHKDDKFEVLSKPWWTYGNEMIAIESENTYYGSFAVHFLDLIESFNEGITPGDAYNQYFMKLYKYYDYIHSQMSKKSVKGVWSSVPGCLSKCQSGCNSGPVNPVIKIEPNFDIKPTWPEFPAAGQMVMKEMKK
jgi:uncharacterized protein YqfB (UPF0267 family)